jgi:hypothetical protein
MDFIEAAEFVNEQDFLFINETQQEANDTAPCGKSMTYCCALCDNECNLT